MTRLWNSLALGLAVLVQPVLSIGQASGPTVKLAPATIRMGAFYSGEWMRISGTVAPGSKAIVVIRGPNTEEVFNRKARAGPIWINSGKVHISGVPSLFLCYSSEPVATLLSPGEIAKRQLDVSEIERQMTVLPAEMDHPIIRSNFVTLKTEENVYRIISNGLRMGAPGEAGVPYSLDFHWPRKAPPAHYEVRVYECRDGRIVARTGTPLEVVKIGFPAAMAALASDHPSLYGVMAVLVAVLIGFGIDFLAAGLRKRLRRAPAPEPERAAAPIEGGSDASRAGAARR